MRKAQTTDDEITFRGTNRIFYTKYLINQIGIPPDQNQIDLLAKKLNIKISIEGPGIKMTSPGNMASFQTIENLGTISFMTNDKVSWTGSWLKENYVRVDEGMMHYLFFFPHDPFFQLRPGLIGSLTMVVLLLFLVTYLFTRNLFKPIQEIFLGVTSISQGNLNYRLKIKQTDELGDLAQSFNLMTTQIQQMLSAKEQLLLDVSHELRSPLTRIRLALDIGGKEQLIRNDLNEINNMLTELLESARLDSKYSLLVKQKINVYELLTKLIDQFNLVHSQVKLINSIHEPLYAHFDRDRLFIALKNIIENALKYSRPEAKPVELSAFQIEQQIIIRIQDFGIGIPIDDQPYIFEPFYRVDKSRGQKVHGYGLGLSLSKKIIEAHGGIVKVSSILDQGTCFELILPV